MGTNALFRTRWKLASIMCFLVGTIIPRGSGRV